MGTKVLHLWLSLLNIVGGINAAFWSNPTISDHIRPYQTISDHIRPYQTTPDHIKPHHHETATLNFRRFLNWLYSSLSMTKISALISIFRKGKHFFRTFKNAEVVDNFANIFWEFFVLTLFLWQPFLFKSGVVWYGLAWSDMVWYGWIGSKSGIYATYWVSILNISTFAWFCGLSHSFKSQIL